MVIFLSSELDVVSIMFTIVRMTAVVILTLEPSMDGLQQPENLKVSECNGGLTGD